MDTEKDHEFRTDSKKKSCIQCGLPRTSHAILTQKPPEINIWFAGKLWKFKNWAEAREKGFYLG